VENQGNRSVVRALTILKALADEAELSLTSISQIAGLSKGTTYRFLKTLESEGFVTRRDNLLYSLGIVMVRLGATAEKSNPLISVSEPYLKKLSEQTSETVSLNVVMNDKRLCIKKIESLHHVRDFIEMNKLLPIHQGASGTVMLAFLEESEADKVISSIDDPGFDSDRLRIQLEEIRRIGYARSRNTRVAGAAAVAAPIFDKSGRLAGGIGLSGPTIRFTEEMEKGYIHLVRQCASEISYHLGYADAGYAGLPSV